MATTIRRIILLVVLCATSVLAVPTPQHYWNFDSNANDGVGSNHAATTNVTHSTSVYKAGGGSYQWGSNAYMTVSNTFPQGGNARSVSCWLKTSYTGLADILSYGSPYNGAAFTVGHWSSQMFNSSWCCPQYQVSVSNLTDNNWHNLIFSFDGTNMRNYYDGVIQDTRGFSIYTWGNTGAGNAFIGKRISGLTEPLGSGTYLDEVGIWSSGLSATDASDINSGWTYPQSCVNAGTANSGGTYTCSTSETVTNLDITSGSTVVINSSAVLTVTGSVNLTSGSIHISGGGTLHVQ